MSVFTKENPFRIIWKIKNYSLRFIAQCIQSSEFITRISVEEEWVLTYTYLASESCLKLICREYSDEMKEVIICSKFEIIGTAGYSLASEVKMGTVKKGAAWEWCHKDPFEMDSYNGKERHKFLPKDCLTIQISMWGDFSEKIGFTRILLRTEIESDNCTLLWNFSNFSSCKSESKRITFPRNDELEISLINSDDEDIKMTIRKVKEGKFIHNKILRCRICLLDSSGYERDCRLQEYLLEEDVETWKFLKKSQLTGDKNTFLVNDVLSLHCRFALSIDSVKNNIVEYYYGKFLKITGLEDRPDSMKVSAPVNMLQKDLQLLYTSRKMTDVTFRIGDKTLSAHKCVLVARSPVFSAMFEQEMLEKKNGVIDIIDVDYNILDTMLMFMYGATMQDLNCEIAGKLMIAADKYQIPSLKEECSIFLKSSISDETVCEILTLSDMVQDKRLIASSVEHIKSNSKNIVQSEEWKQLAKTNSRLAVEVLTRLVLDN